MLDAARASGTHSYTSRLVCEHKRNNLSDQPSSSFRSAMGIITRLLCKPGHQKVFRTKGQRGQRLHINRMGCRRAEPERKRWASRCSHSRSLLAFGGANHGRMLWTPTVFSVQKILANYVEHRRQGKGPESPLRARPTQRARWSRAPSICLTLVGWVSGISSAPGNATCSHVAYLH